MIDFVKQAFLEKDFENLAYFEPYYLKDFIVTSPKRKIM
jgi:tRNA threonylcarbamoyladenosine biosynthesis protein TsaB